ncbi:MAG: anaerobic ribonucleoside-triphosphate reductase, partial [Clostridiales bacterium]|nr:anaerobic ribonucleoside-triphosphate reductase [Clostridiales bacterium]
MRIIKRDGREVPYDYSKIKNAIEAANAEVAERDRLSDTMVGFVIGRIEKRIEAAGRSVTVEEIQDMVIDELDQAEAHRLARHYSDYRLRHELLRKQNSTDAKILSLLRHDNELARQENANKDPVINSTMRDYLASEVSEDICRRYIFPEDVVRAHDEGIIHIHDMGYVSGPISNCELVNLEDMLQNGTVITDTLIEKPHSFSTACNIATQIIAQVASNTYGGQTISLAHLAPFVEVSRQKFRQEIHAEMEAIGKDCSEEETNHMAEMRVTKEVERGIQTIQYQIQTLLTTNGQTPFVSVFMYLDEVPEGQTRDDLALIIEETLKQRHEGIKNEVGVWVS